MRDMRAILHNLIPDRAEAWTGPLETAVEHHEISVRRRAWWLANLLHESAGLSRLEESLSYTPARAMAVWPTRFRTLAAAQDATRSPQRLAELVYGSRLGNRPGTGDGWRYRGRGLVMITGRHNYRAYQEASGHPVLAQPDLLLDPFIAADAAGWYWARHGLNDAPTFEAAVRGINGGLNGLADRKRWLARIEAATPDPAPEPEREVVGPERIGSFSTLVLHDLTIEHAFSIILAVHEGRPAVLRAPTIASRTSVQGGKLDVRVTEAP